MTGTQQPAAATEWVLAYPYAKAPLTLNGPRGNHHWKNQWVKRIRHETITLAANAGIPTLPRLQARLTWFVLPDGRKRDNDNLAPTEKVMFDGLVRAGIVSDDTPDLIHKHRPRIVTVDSPAINEAWMELWVATWNGDPDIPLIEGSNGEKAIQLAKQLDRTLDPWQTRFLHDYVNHRTNEKEN